MKVGDTLTGAELDRLPVGSVAVHDEPDFGAFNTVTRTPDGFEWFSLPGGPCSYKHITPGGWKLVHLSGPVVPRVGDAITKTKQARALPVGSVVVEIDEAAEAASRPMIKVGKDDWLFRAVWDADVHVGDNTVVDKPHRLVFLPDADTGTGRTAA